MSLVIVVASCQGDSIGDLGENADILSWEVSMVTGGAARIVGCLEVDPEVIPSCRVTIYYSDSSPFDIGAAKAVSTVEFDNEQNFALTINDLEFATTYNYCLVVDVNSRRHSGEVMSFTTLQNPYSHQSSLEMSAAMDLSATSSANCYIVSSPGLYKFKTLQGNSKVSVGDIASVMVLWETFGSDESPEQGDLISGICLDGGYVVFMTAMYFSEGNAVIAAKDEDGMILWSWHIWFTDQPQEHKYYNTAGIMMDRNLGATSAKPGEPRALGLLYQWGRKDPFLNSYSIQNNSLAVSTIAWPESVLSDSSHGTIEYSISNPTVFITANNRNYDWYYSGDNTTDDDRWTPSWQAKSVYDPCPPGWRVPDGDETNGVWSMALGSSSSYMADYDDVSKGVNFSGVFGVDNTIWYPASGGRDYFDATLIYVGVVGYFWSSSPYHDDSIFPNCAYELYFDQSGNVEPSSNFSLRASAHSVRCCKMDYVEGY